MKATNDIIAIFNNEKSVLIAEIKSTVNKGNVKYLNSLSTIQLESINKTIKLAYS